MPSKIRLVMVFGNYLNFLKMDLIVLEILLQLSLFFPYICPVYASIKNINAKLLFKKLIGRVWNLPICIPFHM